MAVERVQLAIARARALREGQEDGAEGKAPLIDWATLPRAQVAPARLDAAHVVTALSGREATAFDMLRTRVLQKMRAEGWRSLAITSPEAGIGKTTVALNLAFSLSRQQDLKAMLAEVDLRHPRLARLLDLPAAGLSAAGSAGMLDVLTGKATAERAFLRLRDNLILAPAGAACPNPAEVLHGAAAPDALARLMGGLRPDIALFDLPALLQTDDALAFLGHVDCALLVTAAERTTGAQIETCVREITARTALAGIVLNRYAGPGAAQGY